MELIDNTEKLINAIQQIHKERKHLLEKGIAKLNALNPLSVLSRGYGAVFNQRSEVVKTVNNLKISEIITVKLSDGEIDACINKITEKGK